MCVFSTMMDVTLRLVLLVTLIWIRLVSAEGPKTSPSLHQYTTHLTRWDQTELVRLKPRCPGGLYAVSVPPLLVIKGSSHSGRHIILTAITAMAANVFFLVLIDWCVTFSHIPQGMALHGAPPLKA